ncbi:MAG: hypothetical protein ACI920_002582, partial [Saprospiraceae bacterium]
PTAAGERGLREKNGFKTIFLPQTPFVFAPDLRVLK